MPSQNISLTNDFMAYVASLVDSGQLMGLSRLCCKLLSNVIKDEEFQPDCAGSMAGMCCELLSNVIKDEEFQRSKQHVKPLLSCELLSNVIKDEEFQLSEANTSTGSVVNCFQM